MKRLCLAILVGLCCALALGIAGCGGRATTTTVVSETTTTIAATTTTEATTTTTVPSLAYDKAVKLDGLWFDVSRPELTDLGVVWGPGRLTVENVQVYMVEVFIVNGAPGTSAVPVVQYGGSIVVYASDGTPLDDIPFNAEDAPGYNPLPKQATLAPGDYIQGCIAVSVGEDLSIGYVEYFGVQPGGVRAKWE